ncbi:hypothetical protein MKW92_025294 [Papaver armeniacum]|nr:hypothetical protein MKW92_025294 [Papaver armeniacum]
MGCLSKLKTLNISGNMIESFLNLSKIAEDINANFNKLTKLPDSIGFELVNLKKLGLENLISLEILNVSQNFQYLQTLPYQLITTLPDSIGCLKRLQKLSVEGNPLVYPRIEIMEQNLDTIKEYLSERMNRINLLNGLCLMDEVLIMPRDEMRESFMMPEYRSVDGFSTPKNTSTGVFLLAVYFHPVTTFQSDFCALWASV